MSDDPPVTAPIRPHVTVVVVSFNTRELTRRCLHSIHAERGSLEVEVVVVDNASEDGSAAMVRQEFPQAILIANPENRGFAAASNQGFAASSGRRLLLLNPDAELLPASLRAMIDFAAAHPTAGVIGPRVLLPTGAQQSTTFRYPRLSDLLINLFVPNRWVRKSRLLGRSRYVGLDSERIQEVEVIAGCCMLVPREILEAVGGMDERFFMYGEEVEWCHRIRAAGWDVLYFPGASVLHHAGQSSRQRPDAMAVAMTRSQLRLIAILRGRPAAYFANVLMVARDAPRALLWVLLWPLKAWRGSRTAAMLRPAAIRLPHHVRWLFVPDWCD